MLDRPRIRALLDRLRTETAELRDLASRSEAELLGGRHELAAAKYRFVAAIEACIDLGQHVIATEGLRAPENFADVFAVLGEASLLSEDLVPTMQAMARFRNLLVHHYADVDDRRVVAILQTRLGDFDRFVVEVARLALQEPERDC